MATNVYTSGTTIKPTAIKKTALPVWKSTWAKFDHPDKVAGWVSATLNKLAPEYQSSAKVCIHDLNSNGNTWGQMAIIFYLE